VTVWDPLVTEGLAARRAALRALASVDEHGAWSNIAVPDAIGGLTERRDRAFASHLAYDTLRWEGTLDWALAQHLRRGLDDVEPVLRRVLRLGAVQLLRTSVPARAAVATAVELAGEAVPAKRAKGAGGFVNGVLRSLARGLDDLPWPDRGSDPVEHLVLTTAHPRWVVRDLLGRYDLDRTEAILRADNASPGVTLRSIGDRDELAAELRALGLGAEPGSLPMAVRAPGADPRRLAAVTEGRAVVQDEASMRVALATGAGPGDRVLDLCAGPGGKTSHLAQLVGPEGTVTAVELHPHRARLIEQAAELQGLEVDVRQGDATDPPLARDEVFDVVLLDAPCTGLGTGRRRPEIRWRRAAEEVEELAALQRRMLAAAVDRVAPGGRLTFSVCTWTHAETEAVADHLSDLAGGRLEPLERRQLLPDVDDSDGMFFAVWRRFERVGPGADR
jgi:16S rRNA (cytosine967-C5)-methyltransferase